MAAARILVCAFTPFARHRVNSSQRVLQEIARVPPVGVELSTLVLPVAFARAYSILEPRLCGEGSGGGRRPDAIVLTGMAAAARRLRIERLAVNLADAEILHPAGRLRVGHVMPDADGRCPAGEPIVPGAPLALPSTVDTRRLAHDLAAGGWPVELSLSAGSFVCNDLYFRVLHRLAAVQDPPACTFVHLPAVARRNPVRILGWPVPGLYRRNRRGMPLGLQVRTMRALLTRLAAHLAHVARELPGHPGLPGVAGRR
jgi:pyroglutamyl-peptidase